MDIFGTNLEYFATLGLTRHQAVQRQPFNAKILLQVLKFCGCLILSAGFLIFEANNFQEYAESIYFTSACACYPIAFVVFAQNFRYIFSFIDGWKVCIEES